MKANELPQDWQNVITKLGEGQRLTETMSEWATFEDGTSIFADDLSLMAEAGLVEYCSSKRDVYEFTFSLTEEGEALREELVTA